VADMPSIWDEVRSSYSNMYLEGPERQRNIKVLLENGEDILGVERREFEYVKSVVSFSRDKGDAVFACRTNQGRSAEVRLTLYLGDIFRIRLTIQGVERRDASIPGLTEPRRSPFRFSHTEDAYTITTDRLAFKINRNLWSLEVSEASGKVLRKDMTIGDYAGGSFSGEHAPVKGFPDGPLGLVTDSQGNISLYELMWLYPDEHVYGFGEKFSGLDKRGQRIVSWNNNPLSNENPRTYKNVPFFMSSRGYGTFINASSLIIYQIGHPHHASCSFEVKGGELDYFVFLGPSFKKIIKSYHRLTGTPAIPPRWSFGLAAGGWMTSRDETESLAKRLRREHIPCDMVHSGFVGDRERHNSFQWGPNFPSPKEMLGNLEELGFRYLLYISPDVPRITEMYQEGTRRGFFIKGRNGQPYLANLPYGSSAQVDFSNPGAVRWYQDKLREQMELGVSGFLADYGEAAPVDGEYHSWKRGSEMHNLYPLLYAKTIHEAVSRRYGRALNWERPGYGPVQRYPIQWDGDPGCSFSAMACVLRAGLGYGLSGSPFWSHEIGGFLGKPSRICYVRWVEMGAFTSHSRIYGWQATRREPWEFGEEAVSIFRKYFALKYRLIPFIYSYALEAKKTGLPLMRAMILEYQDDPNCHGKEMQYLFGREFLVAPVFDEDGAVSVYLPEGRWTDYWTKQVFRGPLNLSLVVSPATLPLYVKDDSIIPMGPEAERIDNTTPSHLTLDVYCHDKAEFRLLADDLEASFTCERDEKLVRLRADAAGRSYEVLFNDMTIPSRVTANGRQLQRMGTEREFDTASRGWFFSNGIVRVKAASKGPLELDLHL
jgi:alpha-D-xyloside xylohydrolase